ncbi:Outer membrane protein OmpA [Stigmatella aurantiaca]|uniref:Outer membrane protein OmpA n=1 Tax=Stigmatella aurantiaca TaxID=41 RepID=A0A1H7L259_STIAU|nr:OmpA family protein [Stigmatella aurantiaca]SEK93153.1 Outer membrane protein OmpA [Stigmatella aurantiaca]
MIDASLSTGPLRAPGRRVRWGGLGRLPALAGCLLPLLSATALAQPAGLPEIELERLSLNPSGAGSLILGTGELLRDGGYRFSLTGHYENDPLVLFEGDERVGPVVQHRVTGHLAGAYGLSDMLEVQLQVPVLLMQRGEDLTARGVGRPEEGLALGTPLVGLRLGVLSQHHGDPLDLAVGVNVGLPLGNADSLAREPSLRATPSVMVGRRFGFLRAALDAGALLRPRTLFSDDADVRDEVGDAVRLGAVLATTDEGLRGEVDVIGMIPFRREGANIEALAGVRLPLGGHFEAYALGGVGFGESPGTPTFRGLVGLAVGSGAPAACVAGGKHTPSQCPDLDDDGDGVKNRQDACPTEGGTGEAQGCPVREVDSDGDGILDVRDACPSVAGEAVHEGCPDTDKDGIPDAADQCPSEAGLAAFQGCPDTDRDGLQDSQDACPTEAGPANRKGCPVKDTDGDGVLDAQDSCPSEAGLKELKGCPAKDTDNDTVADHLDNCPSEAGPADNQGCPAKQKQLVAIRQDRIDIKDTVYFDSGKATIQRRSYKLLDQVAKLLKEHPEMENITIEGHTDNVGKPEANLRLSQHRAEAVKDYLARKGVAPQRLEAKGYGQERPIAPNTTSKGRATNRRVEFLTTTREGAQQ